MNPKTILFNRKNPYNSNIVEATCDVTLPNEDPTYQWTISPNSGYTLINDTPELKTELQTIIDHFREKYDYSR